MTGRIGLIILQTVLAALALLAVAFTPPAQGRMLLVPLDGEPIGAALIQSADATVLAPGPLPGSRVVEGKRSLLAGLWAKRIVVMAAPAALCAGE